MKFAQKQLFTSEKNETVANGRLARLRPFQEEEIIREGGRLNHSDFPYFTQIIQRYYQQNTLYQS